MSFENPDDGAIRALLQGVKRIAVVGLSPKAHRDSYRVSAYMRSHGYEIVPVYPREDEILGARVHRSLAEIPGRVDLVNVFRRAEEVAGVVDEFLATDAPAIWLQYDCVDEAAAQRAVEQGRAVVMDRCLMVEHNRLLR
ncbi:MAG: CoA-binding protein [Vicinamibacteria bacterium]|nr:CoA-binding protein [Vicinamibacteria bacterium]